MNIGHWLIPLALATAYIVAHGIKGTLHWMRNGSFSLWSYTMETGGMPSGHGAGVAALVASVYIVEGFSTLLWVSGLFAVIVIRDAFGVRKSAGDQAKLLNILTSKMHVDEKVDVVLGHTPVQVLAGLVIGGLAAIMWAVGLGMAI